MSLNTFNLYIALQALLLLHQIILHTIRLVSLSFLTFIYIYQSYLAVLLYWYMRDRGKQRETVSLPHGSFSRCSQLPLNEAQKSGVQGSSATGMSSAQQLERSPAASEGAC